MNAAEVKACCAGAYSSEAARLLLGDSFHPGGAALTSRLAASFRAGPDDMIVDVASGRGASALQVARELGCTVVGVELSPELVAVAGRAARTAGLDRRVRFLQGDAESLPLPDGFADGVLCECAFCTFPDKQAAAAELARVLRPGGRLALSDVVAVPERLPPELSTVAAWAACIADARPLEEVASLVEEAGLRVERAERHDDALGALVERVGARIRVLGMLDARLSALGLDLLAAARGAIAEGALGYGVVIAAR